MRSWPAHSFASVPRSNDCSILFDEVAGKLVRQAAHRFPAVRPFEATLGALVEIPDCASPGIWDLGAELEKPVDHEPGDRSLLHAALSVSTLAPICVDRMAIALDDIITIHFLHRIRFPSALSVHRPSACQQESSRNLQAS